MKILCIGDSIVEGYPFGEDASWVAHVEELWPHRETRWINAGISGQTTGEIRRRLEWTLQRTTPDLVILSCGTNDFLFLDGPAGEAAGAFQNIEAMAEAARNSGAKVMVAAPPLTVGRLASRRWNDGTDYAAVNRKLKELRRKIEQRCEESRTEDGEQALIFWDVQGAFLKWCGDGTAPEGSEEAKLEDIYFLDGLHPTRKGYREMAEFLCEKLPLMNF